MLLICSYGFFHQNIYKIKVSKFDVMAIKTPRVAFTKLTLTYLFILYLSFFLAN